MKIELNIRLVSIIALLVCTLMVLSGCATSDESEKDQATNAPPVVEKKVEPPPQPAAEKAPPKEEAAPVQEQPKETVKETPPPAPVVESNQAKPDGKFSVQVGAYSAPEKAAQIAATAKTRFSKRVYTLRDERTNNIKVLVGDFDVKDEARRFRDQIIQQFPEDYKGAWVYDVAKH